MKPIQKTILFAVFVLTSSLNVQSQTVSGCDFFPNKETVKYVYNDVGLFGTSRMEIKYVFQGNKTIEGVNYKAYKKFVNGQVPEISKVLYVKCNSNSLIMGVEVYAYNQELVGYEQDITKIIDINATPLYNVSMEPTGTYHLPVVLKPNAAVGEVWVENSFMHGQEVTQKNILKEKNTIVNVQGVEYPNVYVVSQETWSTVPFQGKQKILTTDNYYAKGIGLIKTVKTTFIMGAAIETQTELEPPEGAKISANSPKNELIAEGAKISPNSPKNSLIAEIESMMVSFPDGKEVNEIKRLFQLSKQNATIEQLTGFKNSLKPFHDEIIKEKNVLNSKKDAYANAKKNIMGDNSYIDKELLGVWEEVTKQRYFLKFYPDGMVEDYLDTPEPRNLHTPKHLFRVKKGETLETLFKHLNGTDNYSYYKYKIKRSVDAQTGKAMITLTTIDYQTFGENQPAKNGIGKERTFRKIE